MKKVLIQYVAQTHFMPLRRVAAVLFCTRAHGVVTPYLFRRGSAFGDGAVRLWADERSVAWRLAFFGAIRLAGVTRRQTGTYAYGDGRIRPVSLPACFLVSGACMPMYVVALE
jgi:hypothetical protein